MQIPKNIKDNMSKPSRFFKTKYGTSSSGLKKYRRRKKIILKKL